MPGPGRRPHQSGIVAQAGLLNPAKGKTNPNRSSFSFSYSWREQPAAGVHYPAADDYFSGFNKLMTMLSPIPKK